MQNETGREWKDRMARLGLNREREAARLNKPCPHCKGSVGGHSARCVWLVLRAAITAKENTCQPQR